MLRKLFAFAAAAAVAVTAGVAAFAKPGDTKDVIKEPTKMAAKGSPLDFKVKTIDGKEQNLSDYKGKVVLFVNVASKCGLTPQYKGLEALYEKYKDQGFVILGFPANNFGSQEPGSNEEIKQFCTSKYDVQFPMMSKISVKGDDKHPLYHYLTEKETAGDMAGEVEWNFHKYLVDREGKLIASIPSRTKPDDQKVIEKIENALGAK